MRTPRPLAIRFTLLVGIFAAVGCASVQRQILQSPAAGGPEWRQLESEHFILRTDYADWAARSALETFDRSARALLTLALPAGASAPRQRLDIVLFEHEDDMQALTGIKNFGEFRANIDGGKPTLLMSTYGGFVATFDLTRIFTQHELTHWIFHNAVPGLPPWLNEGLATYWETLRLEDGQALVGSIPPMIDLLADWVPTTELVRVGEEAFTKEGGHRFYSAAWGAVYLLYAKHGDAFARYLSAVAGGARGEAAWRSAFGSFGANELDAERRDWFAADRPWAHALPMAIAVRDIAPGRKMAPADVLVLWSLLRSWSDDDQLKHVVDDLTAAERLAPDSPSVQARLAQLELRRGWMVAARTRLERALAAHPDDKLLLRVRGEAMLHAELARPAAERDFTALTALTAHLADGDAAAPSLRFAARVAALVGDKARAIALAERATMRAPDCVACFDMLAIARRDAGDVEGAIRAEETALRLLPDGLDDYDMKQRLAELKERR